MRIGDLLVTEGLITPEQLQSALARQSSSGRRLGRVLVDLGYVTERDVAIAIGEQLGIRYVDVQLDALDVDLCRRLPEVQARRLRALPLFDNGKALIVGVADPTELTLLDELERILRRPVEFVLVEESKVVAAIDLIHRDAGRITALGRELSQELSLAPMASENASEGLSGSGDDAPVVRLLRSMLEDAVRMRASDIHIEPQEKNLTIRVRIDGQLHVQAEAESRIGPALLLRLKLSAGLDIAEKRLPQDGRFVTQVGGAPVDIRMSTMPTQHGESAVLRLLVRDSSLLSMDRLGMSSAMIAQIRSALARTTGMVLVTGPTGSGKTTTLYAMLGELNSPERKSLTVEDPVEYRMPGVNQIQINEKIGLSFDTVLRSVLRQDPDVILVGEMRDQATVETGLRAAMTGHMVLSTLHTNDAVSTPVRLLDMGAAPYLVAMSLQMVIAQRLVRTVCTHCAEPYEPTAGERTFVKMARGEVSLQHLVSGRGCTQCNRTGYSGRVGVYELFEMTEPLAAMLSRQDNAGFVKAAREQVAGQALPDQVLELALQGRVSIHDAMRMAASRAAAGEA
jgi:MSHA biogenesis protein MshE